MSRMNSFRRQKALAYFRTKDRYYNKDKDQYLCVCGGEHCKEKLTEKEVRVNHKNNDNSNDSHRNIEPTSHACNIRIGFIQRKKYPKVDRDRIKYTEPPATMKKNIEIKKIAKEWLTKNISGEVRMFKAEMVDRLAFVCDANVLTIERLLRGLIVNEEPSCPYMWVRDEEEEFVQLKKFLGPS